MSNKIQAQEPPCSPPRNTTMAHCEAGRYWCLSQSLTGGVGGFGRVCSLGASSGHQQPWQQQPFLHAHSPQGCRGCRAAQMCPQTPRLPLRWEGEGEGERVVYGDPQGCACVQPPTLQLSLLHAWVMQGKRSSSQHQHPGKAMVRSCLAWTTWRHQGCVSPAPVSTAVHAAAFFNPARQLVFRKSLERAAKACAKDI